MRIKIMILALSALLVFAEYGLTSEEYNRSEETQLIKVGNELCPVSGEKVGGMGQAVEYEYNGKIYTFCCAGCIDTFKADPEKYAKLVKERMPEKHSIESKGQEHHMEGQKDMTDEEIEQMSEEPNAITSETEKTSQEDLLIHEYEVFGMDCPGCHKGLEKLIKKIPSVQEAEANWKKKRLIITIRPGEALNDEDIHDAVKRANFTVGKRIK